jgi:hypothetical protein
MQLGVYDVSCIISTSRECTAFMLGSNKQLTPRDFVARSIRFHL